MKKFTTIGAVSCRLRAFSWLALAAAGVFFVESAFAQKVLARARLGNNSEDMEFIPSGKYANQLAIIDGYDVLGIPVMGNGRGAARKLFDVKKLGFTSGPRGIGYVESEKLFVFTDINAGDVLIFADENGNLADVRTIQFPPGVDFDGNESVSYIRRGSPFYPDHLLVVFYVPPSDTEQHIAIVRRDGFVEGIIRPDDAVFEQGIGSACYVAPDHLLLGTFGGEVFLTDLAGHIVSGPVVADDNGTSCEGVAALANGRLVATSYDSGKIFYFDRQLNRLPAQDQDYKIGIGLSRPHGPTWNPDTGELLLLAGTSFAPPIESVPVTLDSRRTVVDLAADGINIFQLGANFAYLPNEHRIGVPLNGPNQVALYGASGLREDTVDLSAVGWPITIGYVPGTQQFAFFLRFATNRGQIKITQRDGTYVRTIDLRPLGVLRQVSFAYFDPAHPSGGKFLVIDPNGDALVVDFNGNLLSRFDYKTALDLPFAFGVTAITSGPYAGAFAALLDEDSEVVIFTLP